MSDDLQLIHVKIPRTMYRAMKRQMRRENKTLSAIMREAVAEWLAQRGEMVEYTVAWGGFREEADREAEAGS